MCSIAGIAGPGWNRAQLDAMVAVQHHRGPDDQGVHINAERTVGLGHNRLSIIDLSPAGHQPMANHNGTCWLVFNGEIYNYVELRAELSRFGHRFETGTDTDRIAAIEPLFERDYCEMTPGSVLFFHCNLLHTSAKNTSDRDRRAFIICYNALGNPQLTDRKTSESRPCPVSPDSAIQDRILDPA